MSSFVFYGAAVVVVDLLIASAIKSLSCSGCDADIHAYRRGAGAFFKVIVISEPHLYCCYTSFSPGRVLGHAGIIHAV